MTDDQEPPMWCVASRLGTYDFEVRRDWCGRYETREAALNAHIAFLEKTVAEATVALGLARAIRRAGPEHRAALEAAAKGQDRQVAA